MRVPRYLLSVVALSAAYYALAHVSLQLGVLPGNVSPVWPPAGLAIAVVLLAGPRMLPGVFVGELLANATSGLPVWVAACMATGNVLEAGAAYAFGRRWNQFTRTLESSAEVLRFVVLAALASTALSATVGVGALVGAGVVPPVAAERAWLTWWLGDAFGAVIVGATILVCWGARPSRRTVVEAGLGFAALGATLGVVFRSEDSYPYLVFPFVVWASLRFAQRGATTVMLFVSFIAVASTTRGQGPFAIHGTVTTQLWRLDFFLVVVSVTALALASVVTERDRAKVRLAASNETLELRVADRTAALLAQSGKLEEAQRVGHLGSWDWDTRTDAISWSDELYRLFGVTRETFDATLPSYMSLLHPEDIPAMEACLQKTFELHEPFEIHHRIRRDGELRWISSRGQVTVGDDGAVARMSGTAQDITRFVQLHDELEHRAMHDPLTGLPNRIRFTELLSEELVAHLVPVERRRLEDGSLAVLFVDIDRFKWINDSLGHEAGDAVLLTIATRLRDSLREDGVVARFGGDEFVVLCQRLTAHEDAAAVARRLLLALAEPYSLGGHDIPLSASIGVAVAHPSSTADSMLRDADAAMYRAKELGGGCVAVYDDALSGTVRHRFETANALHAALQAEQVQPHYQPIVELASGDVVGVEALARWNHPVRGLVPPTEFIAVAEQSGLIIPLGAALLRQACHDAAGWNALRTGAPLSLAVNVSARQITGRGFGLVVKQCLDSSGLPPELLCLELTETSLMQDVEATRETVEELRQLGVRLSVDDFGTGYSSLLYLRRFPVQSLKIDRSFVAGLPDEADDQAIVTGVIELAHGLGLSTVAEGVETVAQLDRLRAAGCELGQGFFWSQARTAEDLVAWLAVRETPLVPAQDRRTTVPR